MKKTFTLLAVLAGLCLFILPSSSGSKSLYRAKVLPDLVPQGPNMEAVNGAVIKLYDSKGSFFCSAVVVAQNYAATAAHCVVEDEELMSEPITVRNQTSDNTGITARAVFAYQRTDIALITGDFSSFRTAIINPENNEFDEFMGAPLLVCGYPLNSKDIKCRPFRPLGYQYFSIIGQGQVFPGMSGGAVINPITGTVSGIISATSDSGHTVVNTLMGIFSLSGIKIKGEQ